MRQSRAGPAAARCWRVCAQGQSLARATWRHRVGVATARELHFPGNPGLRLCRKGFLYVAPAGAPLSASPSVYTWNWIFYFGSNVVEGK